MLKIGDKVKVVALERVDNYTNLKIGTIGTIQFMNCENYDSYNACDVKFGDDFVNEGIYNNGPDGTYTMFMGQLEAAEVGQ